MTTTNKTPPIELLNSFLIPFRCITKGDRGTHTRMRGGKWTIPPEHLEEFYSKNSGQKMTYFSSHGTKAHWDIDFEEGQFLVFGKESSGLPKKVIENNEKELYQIPLFSKHVRSLNLANAVSVVVYEGLKNLR